MTDTSTGKRGPHPVGYSILYCMCILSAFFVLFGCGKKGDPTLKAYEKPDPPSHLTAVCRPEEVILSWEFPKSKEEALKGFYLMRASMGQAPSGAAAWGDYTRLPLLEKTKRTYTDTDLAHGNVYRYRIVSENLKGIVSNDSPPVEISLKQTLTPPSGLSFKIEENSVLLSWKGTGEPVSYNVYRGYESGAYATVPLNKKPLGEASYKDVFDPSRVVYYSVRAVSGEGVRYESAASAELRVNPSDLIPSSPSNLRAVATKDSVVLVWDEPRPTWITGYRIYRELNKKEGYVLLGETPVPTFTDKEPPLTKRNYRVTAVGPIKEGPPAEARNIVYIRPR